MAILSKLLYWSVPLGLFVWSLFSPTIATYLFLTAAAIFEGYLFFIDGANKPKPAPSRWSQEEIYVIRKYHIALSYPFGARDMSIVLNGFRWSALLWVPWVVIESNVVAFCDNCFQLLCNRVACRQTRSALLSFGCCKQR